MTSSEQKIAVLYPRIAVGGFLIAALGWFEILPLPEIVGEIGEFELYSTLRAAEDWGSLGQLESYESIGKIPSTISSVCSEMTSWCQDTTKHKGKLRKGKKKAKGKTKGKATGGRRSSSKRSQQQGPL